ncbi:MAG: S41 family peptidase [Gammaproteobacteria bacterium]
MNIKIWIASLTVLLILMGCAGSVQTADTAIKSPAEPRPIEFDAAAGWDEYENELRSNYAYLDRLGQSAANDQLSRSRRVALKTSNQNALRRVLHQTSLTFMDPHLIVGPFGNDDFNIVLTSADIDIAQKSGRFLVADVRAESAADVAGVRPGWELLSVDGSQTAEAALLPFGEVLPEPSVEQLGYGAMVAANGRRGQNKRELKFRLSDGSTRTVVLDSPRLQARELLTAPPISTHQIGSYHRIGLIRFNNSLGNNDTVKAFDDAIAEFAGMDGVVIDLRNTPSGGNTVIARSVIGHFVNEPRAYQMHTIPAVEREYGVPRRFVEYVMPRTPYFQRQVVVLHGRWTGSMGEGLVIGLDAAANAHTIGSDMGDLLGGLWNIDLPASGARLDLGGEALFHVDGTAREDYVADEVLLFSDRDETGDDPAVRAALAFFNSRIGR